MLCLPVKMESKTVIRPVTTETGRLRIQRQEWQFVVPNVNDLSHGFIYQIEKLDAHGHIPFSLLTSPVQLVVCTSEFRSQPFPWKPQIKCLKCFLLSFHVQISLELEFTFSSLQNTSLLNHALECDHILPKQVDREFKDKKNASS